MKVSLTQFAQLGQDDNGVALPMGRARIGCQVLTAVGAFPQLDIRTRFVRLATDTSIQMDIAGGATDASDELIPANFVEWFSVKGGETLTIAAA